jgi:hypothetical protein
MHQFAVILAKKSWANWDAKQTAARWMDHYGKPPAPQHGFKVGDRVQHLRTGEKGHVQDVSHSGFITVDGFPHHHTELRKL